MSVHEAEVAFLQLFEQLEIQRKPPKNRFPLLKLPRVVLLECIEHLDVLEIIIFSLLSKRAKSIVKRIHWNLLEIHLISTEQGPQIWLKLPTHSRVEWIIQYNKEKESSVYPVFESRVEGPNAFYHLFLYDNGIEDVKQMVEHICEVFHSPICGIRIFEESLIEWIIKFQPRIQYVSIDDKVIASSKKLDHALKNLKVTEHFHLGIVAIDETFQIAEPIPFSALSIDNSYWITLPSILNGVNSIIRLYDSKLTPKDINTILKAWQLGFKLRNLEYLEINTTPLPGFDGFTRESHKDLNLTESDRSDSRPSTVKIGDWLIIPLPQRDAVKYIIRSDGMIGTIFKLFGRPEYGKLKICFRFQVWRKRT